MIVRTAIVGGGYREGALVRTRALWRDELLILRREPLNPHDKNAVAVMSSDGVHLGYVPRTESPLIAKVIDEGHTLQAHCAIAGSTSMVIRWEG